MLCSFLSFQPSYFGLFSLLLLNQFVHFEVHLDSCPLHFFLSDFTTTGALRSVCQHSFALRVDVKHILVVSQR